MTDSLDWVLLGFLLVGCVLWWLDGATLRWAARRIDAKFKALEGDPTWTPMGDAGDIPPAVMARLDEFDAACIRDLGFAPLGRLREFSRRGEFAGVRTVLVNPERTIAAVFACSHTRTALAFRSFVSEAGGRMLCATDANSVSPETPRIVWMRMGREHDPQDLLRHLQARMDGLREPLSKFDSLDAYHAVQVRFARIAREARDKNGNVIDLDTLKRLASPRFPTRRLERLHAEIRRLNRG